jgi:hypothetical protein
MTNCPSRVVVNCSPLRGALTARHPPAGPITTTARHHPVVVNQAHAPQPIWLASCQLLLPAGVTINPAAPSPEPTAPNHQTTRPDDLDIPEFLRR